MKADQITTPHFPSSQIKECIYQSKTNSLVVTFKSGGKYSYHPVAFMTFVELITSASAGSFLNREIIKNPDIKATKL